MTTHDDPYAPKRRGPAAAIIDLNPPSRREPDYMAALEQAVQPPPAPEFRRHADVPLVETPRSDLEQIAEWIVFLTYADMKTLAGGILGADAKPEDAIALADKMHAWSAKARRAVRS